MKPTPGVKTEDATLKMVENEVATVLTHLKKLLSVKDRLCSPLLRLPTETIVHILSFIMEAVDQPRVWQPIFSTCHHIRRIMCTATELWWKVDCARARAARIAFTRSNGNPQVIIADLQPLWDRRNKFARIALDHWRDKQVLHGHRLHTLELCGDLSDVSHFSWLFERPLPRLHRLKICFFGPLAGGGGESRLPIPDPVALQLPMDLPLQILDLSNATLPWSSNLFTGLRELRMDFRDCEAVVDISADELLGVFDASPQLESLSLIQVRPRIPVNHGEPQYSPTRIAQLPSLAFLKLENSPESVGYILVHMNTPTINSLKIRSRVSPFEVSRSLRFFFPNHILPSRLFPNPPVFRIQVVDDGGLLGSVYVTIGGFKMRFDFDVDAEETVRDTITTCVLPMVPSSVAILNLDYMRLSEQEWREFLGSHPEVCSIECSNYSVEEPMSALWVALSPAGTDAAPLCPKLESISLYDNPASSQSLFNCLLSRKNAGFGLRNLKFWSFDDGPAAEFGLLVEEFQVVNPPEDLFELHLVRRVLVDELDFHILTVFPSGNTVAVQRAITEYSADLWPYSCWPLTTIAGPPQLQNHVCAVVRHGCTSYRDPRAYTSMLSRSGFRQDGSGTENCREIQPNFY